MHKEEGMEVREGKKILTYLKNLPHLIYKSCVHMHITPKQIELESPCSPGFEAS